MLQLMHQEIIQLQLPIHVAMTPQLLCWNKSIVVYMCHLPLRPTEMDWMMCFEWTARRIQLNSVYKFSTAGVNLYFQQRIQQPVGMEILKGSHQSLVIMFITLKPIRFVEKLNEKVTWPLSGKKFLGTILVCIDRNEMINLHLPKRNIPVLYICGGGCSICRIESFSIQDVDAEILPLHSSVAPVFLL